jgi:hypothetical protein
VLIEQTAKQVQRWERSSVNHCVPVNTFSHRPAGNFHFKLCD